MTLIGVNTIGGHPIFPFLAKRILSNRIVIFKKTISYAGLDQWYFRGTMHFPTGGPKQATYVFRDFRDRNHKPTHRDLLKHQENKNQK